MWDGNEGQHPDIEGFSANPIGAGKEYLVCGIRKEVGVAVEGVIGRAAGI
jgi:hypothetical protein